MTCRRFFASLLALSLAAYLVACDSDASEVNGARGQDTTPARTAVGAAPPPTTSIMPTGTPTTTAATAASDEAIGWGVATVDVRTGEVATLYEGGDAILLPQARNGAIWLDVGNGEAIRYTLNGAANDRVAGWNVIEGPGGAIRSYFTDLDVEPSPMVVERNGNVLLEVDGARIANRTFSPDGRSLAWLDWTDSERHLIVVAALESGDIETVATVSACACDGFHYLEWSPSSRYLAYDNPVRTDTSTGGIYIHKVGSTEDPKRVNERSGWVVGGWVQANDGEYLLTLEGQVPTLTPPGDAAPIVVNARGSSAATLEDLIVVYNGQGTDQTTLILDPVSGERIRELRGASDAVLTGDGIATAIISRNELTCTGIDVSHPGFEETLECNAEFLRWSSDGRYLALIPQAQSDPVTILDTTTGATTEVAHVGPRGTIPEWSEDSRYLVWVWGAQR